MTQRALTLVFWTGLLLVLFSIIPGTPWAVLAIGTALMMAVTFIGFAAWLERKHP